MAVKRNTPEGNHTMLVQAEPQGGLTSYSLHEQLGEIGTSLGLKTVETTLHDFSKGIDVLDIKTKGPWVDVRAFGAVGDGIVDCTVPIQNSINAVASVGGGTVILPVPSVAYLVTGTLTIKKNVTLKGLANFNMVYSEASVYIEHTPTTPNTDFMVTDAPQAFGYISGIGFEGITVHGSANSRYAFALANPINLKMKNVEVLSGFVDGLRLSYMMNCRFEQVSVGYVTNGIRIHGNVSTSTTFNNCRVATCTTPLIIEQGSALGISFNDRCIFEECDNGLDIHTQNIVTLNDPYFENIPRTSTATALINLGVTGDATAVFEKSACTITGGFLHGTNGAIAVGSSIFNIDKWGSLVVIGGRMEAATFPVIRTAATGTTVFIGTMESQLTNSLNAIDNVMVLGTNFLGNVIEKRSAAPVAGYQWAKGKIFWNWHADVGEAVGWVCTAAGTPGTWLPFGVIGQQEISATATWDPGSLADGAGETSAAITVTGAALGDFVMVAAPYDLQGITCNGYVSAANAVKIRLQNETGGPIDLASGTWKVKVIK